MSLGFDSPTAVLIAIALWCAIVATARLRRVRLTRSAALCLSSGLLLLAIAAGRLHIGWPIAGETVVMVDLSPSTRTAGYRDRPALDRQIRTLLGGASHRIVYFADEISDDITANPLPDLPADTTRFPPPSSATAVVLFSDGRFEPPDFSPPVFAVIDPQLFATRDAAIADLQWTGGSAVATVRNDDGADRSLTHNGRQSAAPPGHRVIVLENTGTQSPVRAVLDPADAWPENDTLAIAALPPAEAARWWVSTHRPPPSPRWTRLAPQELSASAADWLNVSAVVMDNVAADAISLPQQRRITQYVRDLGGAALIIGGDHAFAAGAYPGSQIGAISPLTAEPPQPTRHWLILTDASGSMAQPANGATRLQVASSAMAAVLRALPEEDLITLGSFSDSVHWWIEPAPVNQAIRQPLPPPNLEARGPTNLQPALQTLIAAIDPGLRTEVLLLTDGQATLDNADAFIDAMRQRNMRLHLLATGSGAAIAPLEQIVNETGGLIVRQSDPRRWTNGAIALARQAMPDGLLRDPVQVIPADPPLPFDPGTAAEWNRTWLRDDARLMAWARHGEADVPMIARWRSGGGTVIAAAYALPPGQADALADLIAAPSRDPRFAVDWEFGPNLRISVDAIDQGRYLNDRSLSVELTPGDALAPASAFKLEQVAPGRYEATLGSPRQPMIATVRLDQTVIDRRAVAGRYAPEFERIGGDREALTTLARRTGGRVIEPDDQRRIDLPTRRRRTDATPTLAAGAIALTGIGLLLSRR